VSDGDANEWEGNEADALLWMLLLWMHRQNDRCPTWLRAGLWT